MKKRAPEVGGRSLSKRIFYYKELYLLLLPAGVLCFIFCFLPLVGLLVAFKDYDMFSADGSLFQAMFKSPWAAEYGFKYFLDIFRVKAMREAISNTLLLSVISLIICFPFPIMLAIMVNEIKKTFLKRTIQTISYLPQFLSWIAVIGIFQAFLASDGVINNFIVWISGIFGADYEPVMFLSKNELFIPIIVFVNVWKTVGWSAIIFFAAITSIDNTLYEAAEIDGAGRLKQIIHILIPQILPMISIVFILSMGSFFKSNFELIIGFQNPHINFETIDTLVFKNGLQSGNYSAATALGLTQGLVSVTLVMITNQVVKRLSGNSLF